MRYKTRKALIISSLTTLGIGAVAALHLVTAKHLTRFALDRKLPEAIKRHKKKMIHSKEEAELMKTVTAASNRLKFSGCELVTITSHDGIRLVGHWCECPNAKRVIVAMHGWRSGWSQDFGVISEFWRKSGCSVLYAEQRTHGDSEGDYMGFGVLERYDCYEWVKWVNKRTNAELPIYLGGVSMGATTVLMTSGFKLPENVKGIVADCGFSSPRAIWKHVVEHHFHLPYRFYKKLAEDMYKRRNKVSIEYSCADALKSCEVPVLFIHGTDDRFVPIEMTYENYKACPTPKKLLTVVGAQHGMSYLVDKEGYEAAVTDFWQKYD